MKCSQSKPLVNICSVIVVISSQSSLEWGHSVSNTGPAQFSPLGVLGFSPPSGGSASGDPPDPSATSVWEPQQGACSLVRREKTSFPDSAQKLCLQTYC